MNRKKDDELNVRFFRAIRSTVPKTRGSMRPAASSVTRLVSRCAMGHNGSLHQTSRGVWRFYEFTLVSAPAVD